jgi:hypothetical protein
MTCTQILSGHFWAIWWLVVIAIITIEDIISSWRSGK